MVDSIQQAYRRRMNDLAQMLDEQFNGSTGPQRGERIVFTLFLAEAGKMEGGRVNYISNGNRDEMISMVKEWLNRAEGRGVHTPGVDTKQ